MRPCGTGRCETELGAERNAFLHSLSDNLDPSSTQKLLMKTGLILIVIGHLNFITGALVHGTVLRHIANPQDTISLQYAISNIITVISAILTISCGIAAIVLSRYISQKPLTWAVFSLSVSSTLLSLFCSVGLAVAIVVTFANQGRTLLELCTFANVDLIQISHECPFDPTRVYVSLEFVTVKKREAGENRDLLRTGQVETVWL
ncbi:hypothetical protein JD844_005172 [Phrynosoma platyrhinos]|uniref:Transmembrane protein 54 n=1 Tax=Phrynosoma platyrhinos TaxID=52577 RepID=A0ABQ7TNB9_PHRPL|nr:hypothetical protein JD844_005172 [Phrynosoma platyrhinos]